MDSLALFVRQDEPNGPGFRLRRCLRPRLRVCRSPRGIATAGVKDDTRYLALTLSETERNSSLHSAAPTCMPSSLR